MLWPLAMIACAVAAMVASAAVLVVAALRRDGRGDVRAHAARLRAEAATYEKLSRHPDRTIRGIELYHARADVLRAEAAGLLASATRSEDAT